MRLTTWEFPAVILGAIVTRMWLPAFLKRESSFVCALNWNSTLTRPVKPSMNDFAR